jgi:hypothetical protein
VGTGESVSERFYGRRSHFEKIGDFEPEHRAVLMNETHRTMARSRSKGGGGGGGAIRGDRGLRVFIGMPPQDAVGR